MTRRTARDDFFRRIPRRSLAAFYLAVFFVFAPVSLLLVSSFAQERAATDVLVYMAVSGALAVCWAATFTYSRWFVVGILLLTATVVRLSGPAGFAGSSIQPTRLSLEGFVVVTAIVLGYVLFVVFISGQGRTTLRLMTEMRLAREIHDTLVPPVRIDGPHLEALGTSRPSTEMGGDLVDYVEHANATDLYVSDVSGHGVRAGVVMGMVKAALRTRLDAPLPLARLLADTDRMLEATTSPELYATLAAVRVDHRDRRVEYALAGHHPILHARRASRDAGRLAMRSRPLGLVAGAPYGTGTVRAGEGDLLAIYTDGLNETADRAENELGHDRIERILLDRIDRPLEEIHRAVLDEVSAHGPQEDDRTLLLIRLR